jgi:hypothetical protein
MFAKARAGLLSVEGMVRALRRLGVMTTIVAAMSCNDGKAPAGGECPLGTFRAVGGNECVIPADTQFVNDTRCGTEAMPPTCTSDQGLRPYYATSARCAPGYKYVPGSCLSGAGGAGGGFFTGSAGASLATGVGGSFVDGVGCVGDGCFIGGTGFGGGDGMVFDDGSVVPPPDADQDAVSDAPRDAAVEGAPDGVSGG